MTGVTDNCLLFTPLRITEDLTLSNRVVFTARTLPRSTTGTRVPSRHSATYYEQRAGVGLIISEAIAVSEQGCGWYGAPALYTDAHAEDWRKTVQCVHARGGKMFLQLGHVSSQPHSSFETASSLEMDEIAGIVEMYRACAERAKQAGFDGVEVHGGSGYLVDQFLQSGSNARTDRYGGSFENRARLMLEIVDALKTVWPASRIGVRLAPNDRVGSNDNFDIFAYVMEQLGRHDLAYLAILDGDSLPGDSITGQRRLVTALDAKKAFKGLVMASDRYTCDTAEAAIRSGSVDLVDFRRLDVLNLEVTERFPLLDRVEHLLRAHFPQVISDLRSPPTHTTTFQPLEMFSVPRRSRLPSDRRPRSRSKVMPASSV